MSTPGQPVKNSNKNKNENNMEREKFKVQEGSASAKQGEEEHCHPTLTLYPPSQENTLFSVTGLQSDNVSTAMRWTSASAAAALQRRMLPPPRTCTMVTAIEDVNPSLLPSEDAYPSPAHR
ncbi:hypothetical protein EV401DRAFT_1885232 [Pisolithus croceorrhizus]|nr:hypothetical protein EV401DRAFT_1885232 [Pisolithus croceorrhizus]